MRKNEQGPKELFNYLEQNIVISFHDSASDTWKEYKVNASKENKIGRASCRERE